VRFHTDRKFEFSTWSWQPVPAPHEEKLPSHPDNAQAQTLPASLHCDVEANACGAAMNKAPTINASAANALSVAFRATGTACMYEPPAMGW
jgi:hypothetical protein